MLRLATILALVFMLAPQSAGAVAVDKPLKDAVQEARARDIHKQLRCLVCQNQSIEDSNAELARDLRQLVREQILAGRNDSEVIDYVVARYGDWVLLEPPLKITTLALWASPAAILGLAILVILTRRRRRQAQDSDAAEPLDNQEAAQLAAILAPDSLPDHSPAGSPGGIPNNQGPEPDGIKEPVK